MLQFPTTLDNNQVWPILGTEPRTKRIGAALDTNLIIAKEVMEGDIIIAS